jgi:hypothetical protein
VVPPAGQTSVTTRAVQDFFASAEYLELTDTERLARPSFERLDCGCAFGTDGVTFGGQATPDAPLMAQATMTYETILIGPDGVAIREATPHTPSVETVTMEARLGAVGRATALQAGRYKYQGTPRGLALKDATYVVARRANLDIEPDIVQTEATQGTTYTTAIEALRDYVARHPERRDWVHIVATPETEEVPA